MLQGLLQQERHYSRGGATGTPRGRCRCRNWKGTYSSLTIIKRKKVTQSIKRLFLLTDGVAELPCECASFKLGVQFVIGGKLALLFKPKGKVVSTGS